MPEAKQVIETLFKPEARTRFSDIVLQASKEYHNSIFRNPNRADVINEFAKRHGVIFPIGSIRRGTARPATSDLDLLAAWDDANYPAFSPIGHHVAERIFEFDSEPHHPEHISFSQYLARKLRNSPNAEEKTFFEDRKADILESLEKRGAITRYDETTIQERIEKGLISVEATEIPIRDIIRTIQEGGIKYQDWMGYWYKNETPPVEFLPFSSLPTLQRKSEASNDIKEKEYWLDKSHKLQNVLAELRYIPYILITLPDFVIESDTGALRYLQEQLVTSLLSLKRDKPEEFNVVYKEIKGGFGGATYYLQSNHGVTEVYYDRIIREYLEKSGKFPAEKLERAIRLFKSIRKGLEFPPIESFAELYGIEVSKP